MIIACHHPPASVDGKHGGTTGLANDIDTASKAAGFWPDAVLSGHAHLYQRFTRTTPDGRQIPYVVAGSGGFAATKPTAGLPQAPITNGEYTLVKNPIVEFGYLTVTIDMTKETETPHGLPRPHKHQDPRQPQPRPHHRKGDLTPKSLLAALRARAGSQELRAGRVREPLFPLFGRPASLADQQVP